MIHIITNKKNTTYDYFFEDCEAFFRAKIHSNSFTEDDLMVMKSIDNAILLDKAIGTIKTDFGVTSIDNLSTGCKVVLTYLYIIRNKKDYEGKILLETTECGANALDVLFELAEKYDDETIYFLLRHHNDLFKCKSRDYKVDGENKKILL